MNEADLTKEDLDYQDGTLKGQDKLIYLLRNKLD
jgi:hypothetical protein